MLSSTSLLKHCKCHRQVMKKKQNCWSSINTMHSTLTFYAEMLLHDDVGTSMTQPVSYTHLTLPTIYSV